MWLVLYIFVSPGTRVSGINDRVPLAVMRCFIYLRWAIENLANLEFRQALAASPQLAV
jgi:hypothetical protein